jgi:hypothetical protein
MFENGVIEKIEKSNPLFETGIDPSLNLEALSHADLPDSFKSKVLIEAFAEWNGQNEVSGNDIAELEDPNCSVDVFVSTDEEV